MHGETFDDVSEQVRAAMVAVLEINERETNDPEAGDFTLGLLLGLMVAVDRPVLAGELASILGRVHGETMELFKTCVSEVTAAYDVTAGASHAR